MTKIDIISGFLGAGKTTLIRKLLEEALVDEKVVLIENEFGEIGIDGSFLKDSGIEITEMNSGCICCSLVGDFEKSLSEVLDKFTPDRILIEPSGVGKLSDIISAVKKLNREDVTLNSYSTVVDAKKCKMYLKNFGEFFGNQVENARTIILSHTGETSDENITEAMRMIRNINNDANLITTPWDVITGKQILDTMEATEILSKELEEYRLKEYLEECHCHDHHHEHDEECHCHDHHHHEHDEECHCHDHHHHEHDEECHCHDHHHHEHGEECHCHDHHHHNADEVFTSVAFETVNKYTVQDVYNILKAFEDKETYGFVLRAKGVLPGNEFWVHFDYVPDDIEVRPGSADTIGKLCVIGSNINKEKIKELFRI